MTARTLRFACAVGLVLLVQAEAYPANALVTSRNGVRTGPLLPQVAVRTLPDKGRACGKIGGAVVAEDPAPGACSPLNGAIPPNRAIPATSDALGNTVSAQARLLASFGSAKLFFVDAADIARTKATFAEAEFVDPLIFFSATNDAFDVSLIRSFENVGSSPGLQLAGSAAAGEQALGSYHLEMSTNLTGFLFSLDVGFSASQPLTITIDLGTYVTGLAGWDELLLESSLRTLLDAGTIDNDFSLTTFSFPAIPVHVPAGEELIVMGADVGTAIAAAPEPGTLSLIALAFAATLSARKRTARCYAPKA
jgi:hypothetical protein